MNLLYDPWIPTTAGERGMLDVLESAGAISLSSGGMAFLSILRMLIAACYRGMEDSHTLLRRGVGSRTLKYLEQQRKAFDLHDGYLTCPNLTARTATLATLMNERASGNTMCFHVHGRDDRSPVITEGELARRLLEYHAFAPAGGKSVTGYRTLSPCANVALGVASGSNLLETIALNLVPDDSPPRPSWDLPRVTESDLIARTRSTARSVAELYTWLGQAVRLWPEGVGTARGFKQVGLRDPMTALTVYKKTNRRNPLRGNELEPWLLACRMSGWNTVPAATLSHAAGIGEAFSVRVIAQVSAETNTVKVLERVDACFPSTVIDFELARVVTAMRAYLTRESLYTARMFVSTLEDALRERVTAFQLEEFIDSDDLSLGAKQKTRLRAFLRT